MKFKVYKTIEATPMTKAEAEKKLNKHIENVLYGDYGYLIDNHWVPKESLENQAKPVDTSKDVIWYGVHIIRDLQRLIQTTGTYKYNKTLITELDNLKKLLEQ